MPALAWRLLGALALALLTCVTAWAGEVRVGRFGAGDLDGWQEKVFKGHTKYELVNEDGRAVLRAEAIASASALLKPLSLDPRQYPRLRWSWKIEHTLPQGDERAKTGDDYAARVYVVFPGRYFWQTRAINYIWANHLPQGQYLPNAFSANAMMLAVRSGEAQAGQWQSEERDILEDYRRLFGEEPGEIGAVALMSDADNTGGRVVAYYGDISLASRP